MPKNPQTKKEKVSGKTQKQDRLKVDSAQEVDTNSSSPRPAAARAPTPSRVCKIKRAETEEGRGRGKKNMYKVGRVQRRRERFERSSNKHGGANHSSKQPQPRKISLHPFHLDAQTGLELFK